MSELTEIIKSFQDSAKERIKNPLIGSFFIAFMAYNWKPIYVLLFSTKSVEFRIEHIEANYGNWCTVIVPIILAFFYLIVFPEINAGIDNQLKKVTKRRVEEKTEMKTHSLEQKQKILKLEFSNERIRSGNEEFSEMQSKLDSQQKLMENMNDQHKKNIDNYEKLIEEYKKTENKYTDMLLGDRKVKEKLQNDFLTLIDISGLRSILEKLDKSEKEYFQTFCDFKIFKKINSLTVNNIYVSKYLELKLLNEISDNKYSITAKGSYLYNYLEKKL